MIGHRIKALRMAKGWSQNMLVLRSGVSRSVISKLERGETVSVGFENGLSLAKALGVSAEGLATVRRS